MMDRFHEYLDHFYNANNVHSLRAGIRAMRTIVWAGRGYEPFYKLPGVSRVGFETIVDFRP